MVEVSAARVPARPDSGVTTWVMVDGNEAAARVAYRLSEVVAIYPITPASPMGEHADAWAHRRQANLWGTVPRVVEMQSEGGAAGAVHGSLQAGALTTTFTASQGLLLMLPNMYKIAGELTPMVIHVAARSVATHALSIFGDHSDVMAARQTGFVLLASGSVQEAQDMAAIAHAATLASQVPFLHFFDGFRTSHEVAKIAAIPDETLADLIGPDDLDAHRYRSLSPTRPVVRGTAQNPDVFFQAREAANVFHDAVPDIVAATMQRFAALTGRAYSLFDYHGHPEPERVLVIMGSGAGAAREAVDAAADERVGLLTVRLYRPFDTVAFAAALPVSTKSVVVLDRTKEPGAVGEPLYQDVVTALAEENRDIKVIGGRYGLSSKEFTPAMAARCLAEAARPSPRQHFTVGITDDVTHQSLEVDEEWREPDDVLRAIFFGLGSDGTVGANKQTVKIVGSATDAFAQGYFVYDSKKSGSRTVSHLRFSPRPITSSYLIQEAQFVGVHFFDFLERSDVLAVAGDGATVLINSPFGAAGTWDRLPQEARHHITTKNLRVSVIDASEIAKTAGLGRRVNTVLQTCFFALTDLMDTDESIAAIKDSISDAYGGRGEVVLRRNFDAVDGALAGLADLQIPATAGPGQSLPAAVSEAAPDFVQRVTATILAGHGDRLPVSALPVDGTFPTATAQWEKRSIADEIPIWDPDICIDCGRCALICPHAAIRMKVYEPGFFEDRAATGLKSKGWTGRDAPGAYMTIQVAPDDCTGCGVCVDVCPAKSKESVKHRAINMEPKRPHLDTERAAFAAFLEIPERDRTLVKIDNVKGSQILQPLFEFSGACAGCGETPYIKLMTQLFGDRTIIANATGCSSIYGGNLPTTPYAVDAAGRGPAWSNSLFEDNAEFGLGIRLGADQKREQALALLAELRDELGDLAGDIRDADQRNEKGLAAQRRRVDQLRTALTGIDHPSARRLEALTDALVRTSVWIVGGDGWAYDIGFGGLDHVLASGEDVNILVLDTEVYSNTGGQASKATPRAAVAKFAAGGKPTGKKDLGMLAMAYGDVYVAHVSMGANMTQVVKAFTEAEAHTGPALIIAYSPCIAHGIDMSAMAQHQKNAVESGYWPLYRYDPQMEALGKSAFRLDSRQPTITFADFARTEARFAVLERSNPTEADRLMRQAQQDIDDRWHLYEQMEDIEWTVHDDEEEVT